MTLGITDETCTSFNSKLKEKSFNETMASNSNKNSLLDLSSLPSIPVDTVPDGDNGRRVACAFTHKRRSLTKTQCAFCKRPLCPMHRTYSCFVCYAEIVAAYQEPQGTFELLPIDENLQ